MKKVIEYSRYLPRLRGDHAKLLPLLQHVAFHHKKLNTKRKKNIDKGKIGNFCKVSNVSGG